MGFNEVTRSYIKNCTQLNVEDSKSDRIIDSLEKFVTASVFAGADSILWEDSEALFDEKFKPTSLANWKQFIKNKMNIERFFRAVLYIKEPEMRQDIDSYTLSAIYERLGLKKDETAFNNQNLKNWYIDLCDDKETEEVDLTPYVQTAYALTYQMYQYEFDFEKTDVKIKQVVACLFTVYFDLVAGIQNSSEFQQVCEKDFDMDWHGYCSKIVQKLDEKFREYVFANCREVRNVRESVSEESISTQKLFEELKANMQEQIQPIILAGSAAVGKTTTLEYLQYTKCRECLDTGVYKEIPVVIHLNELRSRRIENGEIRVKVKTVEQLMCDELSLEDKVVKKRDLDSILEKKAAVLQVYFDGFNEIPEDKANIFRNDVNIWIKKCIDKRIPVIITNRSLKVNGDVEKNNKKYIIEGIDQNSIKEYFKKKLIKYDRYVELKNYIEEQLQENGSLEWVCSETAHPHELEAIITIALEGKKFSTRELLMRDFLELLLARESTTHQKTDEEVLILKRWLKAIAVLMNEMLMKDSLAGLNPEKPYIFESSAQSVIPEANVDYDYYMDWASTIPIIVKNDGTIEFINIVYYNYFVCFKEE